MVLKTNFAQINKIIKNIVKNERKKRKILAKITKTTIFSGFYIYISISFQM